MNSFDYRKWQYGDPTENISESMIDIIETPTVNLGFSTTATSEKVSTGDYNNNRQPEMAAETENSYISETMSYNIEI